ncbi:MAG: hypothetical protein ACR2QV_15575 [Gammaproteobacteria bacterium]
MNSYARITSVVTLSLVLAGCGLFDDDDDNSAVSGSTPADPAPTDPTPVSPTPPGAVTFTVAVESVDMVNIDSGQPIVVEGFPIQGGALALE